MHQLCQLCFFITSFENMSTLPNFAQLCPTMHFSHSLNEVLFLYQSTYVVSLGSVALLIRKISTCLIFVGACVKNLKLWVPSVL